VTTTGSILDVLSDYVGTIVGRSIVECATSRCGVSPESVTSGQVLRLTAALQTGIEAFVPDPISQRDCIRRLREALEQGCGSLAGASAKMHIDIVEEYDIVTVRNHARTLCNDVGFGVAEQVKIATNGHLRNAKFFGKLFNLRFAIVIDNFLYFLITYFFK